MKLTSLLNGQHFGSIEDKVRGIVTYRLSPHEQRAFAGAITKGLPNVARRMSAGIATVGPFFVLSYFIFTEVEKDFHQRARKNPDDYKNDQ